MPRYQVILERSAIKALLKAPPRVRKAVERAIDRLADEPRPHGVKRIRSSRKLYRIRVGDFRVVYEIQGARLVVVVVLIGDRKEVYRRLANL